MIVYVDLIFFMNFVIDGVLLLATGWTRKIKMKGWRIAAGAGIGALYVIMMLFPETSILFTLLFKFIFSVLMILVSFGFGQLQRFLRTLGVFYLVNFVAAGGILGIHYLLAFLRRCNEWHMVHPYRRAFVSIKAELGVYSDCLTVYCLVLYSCDKKLSTANGSRPMDNGFENSVG